MACFQREAHGSARRNGVGERELTLACLLLPPLSRLPLSDAVWSGEVAIPEGSSVRSCPCYGHARERMTSKVETLADSLGPQDLRASIVVPTYERVGPLAALLHSLAAQGLSSGSFELIISDDGSGSDLAQAVRSYAGVFDRLVFVTGPNSGPGIARNRGAAVARGRTLAFIDSDCVAPVGWLEHLVSEVERGSGMAHGPVRGSVPSMEPFVHSFQLEKPGMPAGIFAIRRSVFESLGGFDPALSRAGEDHEFFARAKASGLVPYFTPQAYVHHRPRLKRVELGAVFTAYSADLTIARGFLARFPNWRAACVRENRTLLAKASVKACAVFGPLGVPFGRPWISLAGLMLFVGLAFGRWIRTNRTLATAGEPIRVPFREALRYALILPIGDIARVVARVRQGVFFLG